MAISQKAIRTHAKIQPWAVSLWGQPIFPPGHHMVALELTEEAYRSQLPTEDCHVCFVKSSSQTHKPPIALSGNWDVFDWLPCELLVQAERITDEHEQTEEKKRSTLSFIFFL